MTYGLIGLNLAIFLYQGSLTNEQLALFFDRWAVVPIQLSASFTGQLPDPAQEWQTLVTAQFLHGGVLHIGSNMLYLWVFGNNIEDRLGPIRFTLFYLGCGALAALVQWAVAPYSQTPTIGASGAIAGVMGAYLLRFPRAYITILLPLIFFWPVFRLPALYFLGFWFLQQAVYGVASTGLGIELGSSSVAYWAHAGGFVFGLILGPLLGLMKAPRQG